MDDCCGLVRVMEGHGGCSSMNVERLAAMVVVAARYVGDSAVR